MEIYLGLSEQIYGSKLKFSLLYMIESMGEPTHGHQDSYQKEEKKFK